MNTFISLLRGINVSGQKKIKMADLKALYESIGLSDVSTYIQSGNVVFKSTERDKGKLAQSIHDAIQKSYDFKVPITILTPTDIENAIQSNPFLAKSTDTKMLYIGFMSEIPSSELITKVKAIQYKEDEFEIIDKVIYSYLPGEAGRTKFTNNFFENKLKVSVTTRNWRTSLKVLEMCG